MKLKTMIFSAVLYTTFSTASFAETFDAKADDQNDNTEEADAKTPDLDSSDNQLLKTIFEKGTVSEQYKVCKIGCCGPKNGCCVHTCNM